MRNQGWNVDILERTGIGTRLDAACGWATS